MIHTTWEKVPSIILQYYPLDWYVSSGNVNGVAILATLEAVATNSPFYYEEEQILPEYSCSLHNSLSSQTISLRFVNNFPEKYRKKMELLQKNSVSLQSMQSKQEAQTIPDDPDFQHSTDLCTSHSKSLHIDRQDNIVKHHELLQSQPLSHQSQEALKYYKDCSYKTITISYEDILLQSDAEEATVFRYISEALHHIKNGCPKSIFNGDSKEIVAYNGILADNSDPLDIDEDYLGFVLLLQGSCCPKVNLARDTITALPLETACNLSLMLDEMPHKLWDEPPLLHPEKFAFPTERELLQLLQGHSVWDKQLQQSRFAWGAKRLENGHPSLMIHISPPCALDFPEQSFCDIKGMNIMLTDKNDWQSVRTFNLDSLHDWLWLTTIKKCSSTGGEKDSEITNYPVILFLLPPSREGPLGYITSSHRLNYYNREHCFSRWLIRHRKDLQKNCLDIYNRLIYTMIQSDSKTEVIEIINHALMLLRNFQHNIFEVSEAMLLESKDLIEKN